MSTASFKIIYCGPALEAGTMDVRELAPALLAFGSLLEESNRAINGPDVSASVRVKRFDDGSFGISFEVIQNLTDQLIGFLNSENVTAATKLINLLGFAGITGHSLWKLIKTAKGRKPKKATKLEDGNIQIDFGEYVVLVEEKVFILYRDIGVRKALANALKPLEKEGIEKLEIKSKGEIIESATKQEVSYFQTPEIEDEIISENEREAVFSIHSLSFKEENKWRLSDGTTPFFVTIKDHEFLRKVNENLISFSKGDLLTVRLVTRTWETVEGLKTEYEATEAVSHKSAAKQVSFPFETKGRE